MMKEALRMAAAAEAAAVAAWGDFPIPQDIPQGVVAAADVTRISGGVRSRDLRRAAEKFRDAGAQLRVVVQQLRYAATSAYRQTGRPDAAREAAVKAWEAVTAATLATVPALEAAAAEPGTTD